MCLADFGNRILRNYEQSESRLWTEYAAGLLPSFLELLLSKQAKDRLGTIPHSILQLTLCMAMKRSNGPTSNIKWMRFNRSTIRTWDD